MEAILNGSAAAPSINVAAVLAGSSASLTTSAPAVSSTASSASASGAPAKKVAPAAAPKKEAVPSTAPPPKKSSTVASGKATTAEETDVVPEECSLGVEDAKAVMSDLNIPGWDAAFHTNMESAKWQERVDALTALADAIKVRY